MIALMQLRLRAFPVLLGLCIAIAPLSAEAAGAAAASKAASSPSSKKAAPAKEAEPAPEEVDLADLEPEESEPAASETTAQAGGSTGGAAAAPAGAALVGPAAGQHLVFLEAGFRQDLGTFSQREVVGQNVQTNQDEVDTFGAMFHVGFLERVAKNVRVGGGFGYGGNYAVGNDLLGQLMTFDMRVELSIPVTEKWAFIGTPRLGMSMIIPGGMLADRINQNQENGYNTWSGPRYGFLAGADVGARYGFTPWLSARATVGYAWFIMLLMNSSASDGTITAAQSWTLQASRLSGNIGLEVTF